MRACRGIWKNLLTSVKQRFPFYRPSASARTSSTATTGRPVSFRFTCTSVSRQMNSIGESKTVMTIHNLKFQGIWDRKTIQSITGLSDYYFTPDKLEFKHDASYLKGGLVYADAITTVSNTYAQEIQTPFYGEGLDGLMCARANDLRGIVNGLDYNEWNPETDAQIAKNFNVKNFRKEKVKNKLALQEELGLEVNPKTMMIGIVSRLTDQKGFDLISYMMDEMCQDAVQFVILGTGEERYENMFRHFAWKYDKKVSANIYYSDAMSHKIYASCDAFLMPSLFEPCGLSQLMSLRYGTLPIVRETGGLKDTVEPYNEYEGTGTGFSFTNYNAHEMMGTVRYAERIYYDKKTRVEQDDRPRNGTGFLLGEFRKTVRGNVQLADRISWSAF